MQNEAWIHELSLLIGDFEHWYDFYTKEVIIRTSDGKVHRVGFVSSVDQDTFRRQVIEILNSVRGPAVAFVSTDKPEADRVKKINDELDILRGVVPTPKGYNYDVKRVRPLMRELNELMKKDEK